MEQSFSQRMGLKPIRNTIQINSMDENLRKALWNDLTAYIIPSHEKWMSREYSDLLKNLWISYYKNLLDDMPSYEILEQKSFKEYFFNCQWNESYDLLEFIVSTYRFKSSSSLEAFLKSCNLSLERELSAYRFIGKNLVQITSDEEVSEIEEALRSSRPHTQHLDRALELLSDRKSPDYRNSIKEAISAVEAMCKLITGSPKGTLGDTLRQLESKLGTLHPALRNAFNNLYGYTSDAEGIRHGMLGKSGLGVEDAKFMLIACSAFINYLVAKAEKAGIVFSRN